MTTVLDAIVWSLLPEHARVARTASLVEDTDSITRIREIVRETQPRRGTTGRLTELVLLEVDRQRRIRKMRAERRSAHDPLQPRNLLAELITRTNREVVAAWKKCGYRRPRSKWAGGDWDLEVMFSRYPQVTTRRDRVWSSNGKWSGQDVTWTVWVPKYWYTRIRPNPITDDGELILDRTPEGVMVVVRQSRGLELRLHRVKG